MDEQLMFAAIGTTVLVLLFSVGLYILWRNLLLKFQSPYVEGKVGFWRAKSIQGVFHRNTIGGFRIAYRLTGLLTRVDNYEFEVESMLDEENQRKPLRWFDIQAIGYRFKQFPFGDWFLVYAWTNHSEPYAFAYRNVTEAGEYELDANQVDLVNAANTWAQEINWKNCGCTFDLQMMDLLIDPELIEANYTMLTTEQRHAAENDPRYLMVEEHAVVAALKRRMDFLEPSEVHKCSALAVTSTVVDQAVLLKWEIKADSREHHEIKGFRRERGFHSDKSSKEENGVLVVDSTVNGSTVDHPPTTSIQFYTFMLFRIKRNGDRDYLDSVRFQVRVPEKSEVDSLKTALEKHRAAVRDLNRPRNDRLETLMAKIDFGVETATALVSAKKRRIEKVKARDDLNQDEKELIVEEIERRFEAAHMHIDY